MSLITTENCRLLHFIISLQLWTFRTVNEIISFTVSSAFNFFFSVPWKLKIYHDTIVIYLQIISLFWLYIINFQLFANDLYVAVSKLPFFTFYLSYLRRICGYNPHIFVFSYCPCLRFGKCFDVYFRFLACHVGTGYLLDRGNYLLLISSYFLDIIFGETFELGFLISVCLVRMDFVYNLFFSLLFLEVPMQSQVSERSCISVLEMYRFPLFLRFRYLILELFRPRGIFIFHFTGNMYFREEWSLGVHFFFGKYIVKHLFVSIRCEIIYLFMWHFYVSKNTILWIYLMIL